VESAANQLRLKEIGGQMKPAPVKPDVTFDVLQKLYIRVGTIESVDGVEGSKKLIKLIVNLYSNTSGGSTCLEKSD
jgi:tRNA-binding EMAP/Myf-like protein